MAVAAAALVIAGKATRAGLTVITNWAVPVPFALLAVRLTVAAPAWVGVPVMAPLAASIASPSGRPDAA